MKTEQMTGQKPAKNFLAALKWEAETISETKKARGRLREDRSEQGEVWKSHFFIIGFICFFNQIYNKCKNVYNTLYKLLKP